MRNKNSIQFITVSIIFSLFFGFKPILAQQTINGRVIDDANRPLPGVAVVLKKTLAGPTVGTTTDIDGSYTINVPDSSSILQFIFLGFVSQEVTVANRERINITLLEERNELEAAVVVGYQKQQKKFVTGSVASVNTQELAELPTASFAGLLAGKATGVMAMNLGGAPGSAGAITIRGNTVVSGSLGEANQFNNPLYVIDGVPTTLEEVAGYGKTNNDFLSSLNTDDIASIDILKDASAAAIYGSRGANGVIIIKTKAGVPGKMKVNFKSYVGISVRPKLTKMPVGAAERREKMKLIYDSWAYESLRDQLPIMLTDSLNPSFNNNMDYQGLFYQTGKIQDYNASITGGSEELNFRLGIGYYTEEGIIKNTGLDRYSLNMNVSQKPWKNVRNQTIINASITDRQPGMSNANSRGSLPVSPKDMKSSLFYVTEDQHSYLTGELKEFYLEDRNINASVTNILNIDIWKGLSFNSQLTGSFFSNKRNEFKPSIIRSDKQGAAYYDYNQHLKYGTENYLSFTRDIFNKDHNVNILIGQSFEYNNLQSNTMEAKGGSGDEIKTISGYKKDDITQFYTGISENAMLSYWLRFGYRFKERYMIDFNYRRDASSRFGKNCRWGEFPSIALGWIFTEESFVKKYTQNWLTFGKIKYSIGRNGRQFTDDYLRYNMYTLSYNGFPTVGGRIWTGNNMAPRTYNGILASIPDFSKLADDNLSWENSVQSNFGFDLEFFKNRVYISYDFYVKKTDQMLFSVQFPDYTGFSEVKSNIVGIRNVGYELTIDAHLFPRDKAFTLQLQTGISHNENAVTSLPNGNRDYYVSGWSYGYVLGMPAASFWGGTYLGPLQNINDLPVNPFTGKPMSITKDGVWGVAKPGYPVFADVNGNYLVSDSGDEDWGFVAKDPNPKVVGHFNIVTKYKNWQLRINTNFIFGRDIFDEVSRDILGRFDWAGNWVKKSMINVPDYDFWTPENPNAKLPSLIPQADGIPARYAFRGGTSMWWEKGDYWKINDITLSYNFDGRWMKSIGIDRLYVHATMFNVWQWQASKNIVDASQVDSRGYTFGDGYPMPRKYVFGINLQF